MSNVIRVLIAGVGGQGIHGFVKTLQRHLQTEGFEFISARYKGGAQSLGSVHAECKIFLTPEAHLHQHSSQIIPGTLDMLLGLECWETLRFLPYCHQSTLIICDTFTEYPPGTKRKPDQADPETLLSQLANPLIYKDFNEIALRRGLDKSKLPALLFNEACAALQLPINPILLNP